MKLEWKKVHSCEMPLNVDTTLSENGVYVRKNIEEENGQYSYDEVVLSNDYRFNITDQEEYMAKLLEVFKEETLKENEEILAEKKTITTSIGEFSIKTPTYDFIFCLMALKDLPTGIAAGKIRFANGDPVQAMTQAQVQALYFEFTSLVAELDTKFTAYKNQILAASDLEALENISIIY